MKIGILRENKVPHDFRVPFTPEQANEVKQKFNVDVIVQPSPIRCFDDSEYQAQGIEVREDVSDCDILFGVKEVPVDDLIPNKTYVFFSHTIKKQEHNQKLMRALLDKNITMIDYEVLVGPNGQRLTAFGREAGIVGAYNALKVYGKRNGLFDIPLAHTLKDVNHLYDVVSNLPTLDINVMNTGAGGRVSGGVVSVLEKTSLKSVSAQEYLSNGKTQKGMFVALSPKDYIKRIDNSEMVETEFFADPSGFESNFLPYAEVSDIYVSGHFWDRRSSVFFDMNDIADKDKFPIEIISDVSCDLPGPIPTTLRETKLDNISYDVSRQTFNEEPVFNNKDNITITAVDNLPSSIPRDASSNFGASLINEMLEYYMGNDDGRIEKGTICKNGKLTPTFAYLQDYADGK
ncbi:MAG: NAD(P)-dependent oxidoreductase [Alphaproteobacteria bacterium]